MVYGGSREQNGLGRSDVVRTEAQRSGHQRRAVPRLVARFVALLRPSYPCDPARSTVPSLDCGAPPSTAVIPLPLRSDLAPSSPVGILGGVNHLATIRGRLREHVCVLRTPSSFTSPNTLYSTLLPTRSYGGWLELPDDMRSQDPPSVPHEVVKTGLPPFLARL